MASATVKTAAGAVLLAGAALLAGRNLLTSWTDVHTYGGGDLRARVVAARVYALGKTPYRPLLNVPLPETLIDPMLRVAEIARVTNSPPVIAAYAFVSARPYRQLRILFYCLEWAALFGSIALFLVVLPTPGRRVGFAIVALLFFAASSFFRLHVERGQVYAFMLLAVALAAVLVTRDVAPEVAGLMLGVFVAGRPSAGMLVPVLYVLGRRRLAIASAVATVALCALPEIGHSGVWRDYSQVLRQAEDDGAGTARFTLLLPPYPPLQIEGADFSVGLAAPTANLNIYTALRTTNLAFGVPAGETFRSVSRVMLFATVLGLVGLAYKLRSRASAREALAVALVAAIAVDYCSPYRYGYNDIVFLAPLALFWPEWTAAGAPRWPLLVVLVGLVLGSDGLRLLSPMDATAVRSIGVMGALLAWPALLARRPAAAAT